jgi:hypothetical protein
MKLTWHIVQKDFQRLWLPLTLWLVLVLARTALLWVGVGSLASLDSYEGLGYFADTWGVIVGAVGFLLAAWLVMEDSLVDSRAFWPTRPISGGRLFVAKVLGAILMFSVLPVFVMCPIWLSCGFSGSDLGLAALELALKQGIFTVAAFAIASVTETSGQFMVRLIGTVVLVPLGLMYCAGIWNGGPQAYLGDGLAESRYRLVVGIFALIPVAMVTHQYLTRRQWRSYVLFGVGVALMFAVRLGWHWDLSSFFRKYPAENAALIQEIRFTLEPATLEQRPKKAPSLHLSGTVSGTPAGAYVRLVSGRGWWGEAAGPRPGARFNTTTGQPPESVVRQVAGQDSSLGEAAPWKATGSEPTEALAQARMNPTRFQIELKAELMRGRILGELPLREGAVLQSGASRTRITGLERRDGRQIVWIEECDAWPPWSTRAEDSFLLRNPAVPLDVLLGGGDSRTVQLHSISARRRQLVITVPTREVNGRAEEIPGWEETAVLVKVRFTRDHELTRLLVADLSALPAP